MTHDPSGTMMWVGALFVATPLVFAGIVIGVWWWQRRRSRDAREGGTGKGEG